MNGNRSRMEARAFWQMVQDNNCAKLPTRQIQAGTSCASCDHYKPYRCTLKKKLVRPYNVCPEWK